MSTLANAGEQDYALFKKKQLELVRVIKNLSDTQSKLGISKYNSKLKEMQNDLKNSAFKILVLGTFITGKSTFINSFLGDKFLPVSSLPCTNVIAEVKYGHQKRTLLHFHSNLQKVSYKGIPDKALMHLKKYNMKDVPPLEIPYSEIERYIAIPQLRNPEDYINSPFKKVELYLPLELLKNGVEIIDTPGMTGLTRRDSHNNKIIMDYIAKADAILFFLKCRSSLQRLGNGFSQKQTQKERL